MDANTEMGKLDIDANRAQDFNANGVGINTVYGAMTAISTAFRERE
jgi:hypothetical protein